MTVRSDSALLYGPNDTYREDSVTTGAHPQTKRTNRAPTGRQASLRVRRDAPPLRRLISLKTAFRKDALRASNCASRCCNSHALNGTRVAVYCRDSSKRSTWYCGTRLGTSDDIGLFREREIPRATSAPNPCTNLIGYCRRTMHPSPVHYDTSYLPQATVSQL